LARRLERGAEAVDLGVDLGARELGARDVDPAAIDEPGRPDGDAGARRDSAELEPGRWRARILARHSSPKPSSTSFASAAYASFAWRPSQRSEILLPLDAASMSTPRMLLPLTSRPL